MMTESKRLIEEQQTEYVARLANLSFSAEELVAYTKDLESILNYMQELNTIHTDGVEATTHVLPLTNVFREDCIGDCLPNHDALSNAPDSEDGSFKVPKIM